eukprot:627889-Pyramimonas_sp.AAC.1
MASVRADASCDRVDDAALDPSETPALTPASCVLCLGVRQASGGEACLLIGLPAGVWSDAPSFEVKLPDSPSRAGPGSRLSSHRRWSPRCPWLDVGKAWTAKGGAFGVNWGVHA